MRLSILLAVVTIATAAPAAGAQSTTQKPDLATLLWLQTLRAHPELASGGPLASSPVQERYDQILRRRLGMETPSAVQGVGPALTGPITEPTLDMEAVPGAALDKEAPVMAAPPKNTIKARPGARLTPFEMCVKDGGCDGIK